MDIILTSHRRFRPGSGLARLAADERTIVSVDQRLVPASMRARAVPLGNGVGPRVVPFGKDGELRDALAPSPLVSAATKGRPTARRADASPKARKGLFVHEKALSLGGTTLSLADLGLEAYAPQFGAQATTPLRTLQLVASGAQLAAGLQNDGMGFKAAINGTKFLSSTLALVDAVAPGALPYAHHAKAFTLLLELGSDIYELTTGGAGGGSPTGGGAKPAPTTSGGAIVAPIG